MRRSLPLPTMRAPTTHRPHSGSPSSSSISQHLENSRPNSFNGIASRPRCSGQTTTPGSNIGRPPRSLNHSAANSKSGIGRLTSKTHTNQQAGSVAGSSIGLFPIPPHRHELPTSSTATSPTTAYGFFTPANAATRSTANGRKIATPKGPQQCFEPGSGSTTPTQTPSKKAASPYLNTHVADPCIPGCKSSPSEFELSRSVASSQLALQNSKCMEQHGPEKSATRKEASNPVSRFNFQRETLLTLSPLS